MQNKGVDLEIVYKHHGKEDTKMDKLLAKKQVGVILFERIVLLIKILLSKLGLKLAVTNMSHLGVVLTSKYGVLCNSLKFIKEEA